MAIAMVGMNPMKKIHIKARMAVNSLLHSLPEELPLLKKD